MCGVAGRRHEFSTAEKKTLGELRRAVFARRAIAAGEVLRAEDIFVAIPGQPGQLTANDLSKYAEYRTQRAFAPREPIMRSDVSATDTRSVIHGIVRDVKALLAASGAIVPSQLELEVSHHYGLEKFRQFGSTTITVVNRDAYCKRVILILPGQTHPEQWHEKKDETYHLLHGEIDLLLDGQARKCRKNDVIIIPRGVKHAFTSAGGAVIEEISSAYSQDDSFYSDPSIGQRNPRKTYVTNWMD
jgi:quercetin dioxygenase-like cupin family protein